MAPRESSEVVDRADAYVLGTPVCYLDVNSFSSALKSVYYFFFCKGLRGINPLPVSRFNYDKALREAFNSGKLLVELSEDKRTFRDLKERIAYHFGLKYMSYDMVDEILLLAEQVIEISREKGLSIEKAKTEYEKAKELIHRGR